MESQLAGDAVQHFLPILMDIEPPTLAPQNRVSSFESEIDAIRYSIDEAWEKNRSTTDADIAQAMGITRQVFSKVKQNQVAIPKNKVLSFMRATKSYALLQFYAMRLGLILKSREEDQAEKRRSADLQRQLDELQAKYKRVVDE